jgi:hypothetical protein
MPIAECGMEKGTKNSEFPIPNLIAPDGPASFCGSTGGSPEAILFPPMLFARSALASGPQARFFAEKAIAKVKVGKTDSLLDTAPK